MLRNQPVVNTDKELVGRQSTWISPSGPRGGSFAAEVGIPLRGASATVRLSRWLGGRSLDGSLIVRGLERVGAAMTEPASEERESSWKVVGLMFLRDIG